MGQDGPFAKIMATAMMEQDSHNLLQGSRAAPGQQSHVASAGKEISRQVVPSREFMSHTATSRQMTCLSPAVAPPPAVAAPTP